MFEPNQASNVSGLALGGTRMIALAGANGMVFVNDPGETDWAVSNLDNVGIHAGLSPMTAAWNGARWVVGSNLGVFVSAAGVEPWTRVDPGLGPLNWVTFATRGRRLFGAFSTFTQAVIEESDDDGTTWHGAQVFPTVFIHDLAVVGNTLFAGRADGLWQSPALLASASGDGGPERSRFALVGPQPFRDRTRLRFELPLRGVPRSRSSTSRAAPRVEPWTGGGPPGSTTWTWMAVG